MGGTVTEMSKDDSRLPVHVVNRWRSSGALPILYGWLVRIAFIGGAVLGWFAARWPGVLIGLIAGSIASLVLWVRGQYVAARERVRTHLRDMSEISPDQLRRMVRDPIWPDAGFAAAELARRGIDERPSIESLFALLTAPDSQQRALGMSLLSSFFPEVGQRMLAGWSSSDSPKLWRERVESMIDSSQPPPASDLGIDGKP
jgi:hypothetical protein